MKKLPGITYTLLLVLHLLTILVLPHFMTHDGPCHTYNAAILHDLLAGKETLLAEMHRINVFPEPNLSGHYLMALLMFVFPPLVAEKILLCLYVVLFAAGCRYFLKQVTTQYATCSLLAFPFIYNVVFYFGFYNFILGLGASLFFFGLFLRWKDQLRPGRIAWLALLSLFIYFSHLLAFLFCGFFAGLLLLSDLLRRTTGVKQALLTTVRLLLLFLPGLVFSAAYFASQEGSTASYNDYSLLKRLGGLLLHAEPLSFMAYSEGTYVKACLAILLLLFVLAVIRWRRDRNPLFPVLSAAVIFSLMLYAVIPDALSGGSIIVPRIGLYFFIFLVAAVSCMQMGRKTMILVGIYVLSAVGLLIFRWQVSAHVSKAAGDFLRVSEAMEKGKVFFTIKADPLVRLPDGFEIHTQMYLTYYVDALLALKTGGVNARNYEVADASDRSYFATRWKPGYESGGLKSYYFDWGKTETIDFARYNARNKRPIDYILLYAEPGKGLHDTLGRFMPEGYKPVAGFSHDYIRLYRYAR